MNSQIQVDLAQEAADELGLELKTATVTTVNDIPDALGSLGDIDALYVPTDNMLVSGIDALMQFAETNQLLVVTGDSGPVEESGAVATLGLNYEELGYQTGQMAIKVLTEGADPATMAVEAQTEFNLIVNKSGAEALGVELPQAVLDKAETVIE